MNLGLGILAFTSKSVSSSSGYISGPIIFSYLRPKCRFIFSSIPFPALVDFSLFPQVRMFPCLYSCISRPFPLVKYGADGSWWSCSACRVSPPQMQWGSTSNLRLQFLLTFPVHKKGIGDRGDDSR